MGSTVTDTGSLLLAGILAEPESDTRRLVLADWLEENGQPERAEFIRLQIELDQPIMAVLPGGKEGRITRRQLTTSAALVERERELLDAHWSEWIRGAGIVPDGWKLSTDGDSFHVWCDTPFDDGFRFKFARGFVASVTVPTLAALLGACMRCGPSAGCPCGGSGLVPTPAARGLWEREPVTECNVSCRSPWHISPGLVCWWTEPGPQCRIKPVSRGHSLTKCGDSGWDRSGGTGNQYSRPPPPPGTPSPPPSLASSGGRWGCRH